MNTEIKKALLEGRVTYEIAVGVKTLGYHAPCQGFYTMKALEGETEPSPTIGMYSCPMDFNTTIPDFPEKYVCSAPTYLDLKMWFLKFGLYIDIKYDTKRASSRKNPWYFELIDLKSNTTMSYPFDEKKYFIKYQQACAVAVKILVDNLIEIKNEETKA